MLLTIVMAVQILGGDNAPEPMSRPHNRPDTVAQSWGCSPRKTCTKIRSCDEAMWYLENCSWGGGLDRDGDGAPCENLCGSNN